MGQAKKRGSFEERQAQAKAAQQAKFALMAQKRKEAQAEADRQADERYRQQQEARRLHPKFAALPPVLQCMVLKECTARGVHPLWLDPPPPEPVRMTPLDARRRRRRPRRCGRRFPAGGRGKGGCGGRRFGGGLEEGVDLGGEVVG